MITASIAAEAATSSPNTLAALIQMFLPLMLIAAIPVGVVLYVRARNRRREEHTRLYYQQQYPQQDPVYHQPYQAAQQDPVHQAMGSAVSAQADALKRLAALHRDGILTDEEFQQKKKDILSRFLGPEGREMKE